MSDITTDELELVAEVLGEGLRVEFAPQDEVEAVEIQEFVGIVLEAVGHPEAWVTDESMIGDFWIGDTNKRAELKRVSEQLGIPIESGDYIHEVAQRLRESALDV